MAPVLLEHAPPQVRGDISRTGDRSRDNRTYLKNTCACALLQAQDKLVPWERGYKAR